MAVKPNPDLLLAKTLAAPFTSARSQGTPLSCRGLPDGGMVIVAADGRKLWFSRAEVDNARSELEEQNRQEKRMASAAQKRVPIRHTPLLGNDLPLKAAVQKGQVKK